MNARAKAPDLSHPLQDLKHFSVVYVCVSNPEHILTLAKGAEKPETRKCPDCGGAYDMRPTEAKDAPHGA